MPWTKRQGAHPKYRTPEHRRYRAALVTQLKRDGYLTCTAKVCVFTTRHITNPNGRARDGLHAGHNDAGTQYDGPQHNACNVKDGARRGRARQDTKTTQLKWLQGEAAPHPWLEQDNHPCPVCGALVLWASQRCCSKRCANAYRAAQRPPKPPRLCVECSAPIEPVRGASKYCEQHRHIGQYRPRSTTKPCSDCGEPMVCRQGPKVRCADCAKKRARRAEMDRRRRRRQGECPSEV